MPTLVCCPPWGAGSKWSRTAWWLISLFCLQTKCSRKSSEARVAVAGERHPAAGGARPAGSSNGLALAGRAQQLLQAYMRTVNDREAQSKSNQPGSVMQGHSRGGVLTTELRRLCRCGGGHGGVVAALRHDRLISTFGSRVCALELPMSCTAHPPKRHRQSPQKSKLHGRGLCNRFSPRGGTQPTSTPRKEWLKREQLGRHCRSGSWRRRTASSHCPALFLSLKSFKSV